MGFVNSIIPISVLAAIVLFVARECLDVFKKKKSDSRRLGAIKKVVARELELNLGAIKNIQQVVSNAENCLVDDPEIPEKFYFAIKQDETGEPAFNICMESGGLFSQTPIREIHTEILAKHLVDIATLDDVFSGKTDAAYDAQMELAHIRRSLLLHFNPDHPDYEETLVLPFCRYAKAELERVFSALDALYVSATGSHLTQSRLR